MASLLDNLSKVGVDTSGLATKEGTRVGENILTRDADSYVTTDGNQKGVRVVGVDAPEVQHLGAARNTEEFDFDYHGQEQVGGKEVHAFANNLIENEGYDQTYTHKQDRWGWDWLTGEKDQRDIYDRDLGDSRNEKGDNLSSRLIASGVVGPDRYTEAGSAHHVQSVVGGYRRAQRAALGEQNSDDLIVRGLDQLKRNSGLAQFGSEILAKNNAANETVYGAAQASGQAHLFNDITFRDKSRTKGNEVRGIQLDEAWDVGSKNGVAGIYTSLGMIGEVLNVDSIENFGYGHADRLKREIGGMPKLRNSQAFDPVTGEWTLDGITDFVDFATVNLATSAPVMLATMAAVATAVPTFGASLAAPVSIYTGQNYDAQADDNKQMGKAFGIGILQTALDVVGVKVGGGAIASAIAGGAGRKAVVNQIAKQKSISKAAAENVLAQAIKGRMTDVISISQRQIERGLRTKAQQAATAGVAFSADALVEGGTEALQEVLGVYAEDNNDWDGLNNRLLNSFFAGATLGGGFSLAGSASQGFDQYNYAQGQKAESAQSAANDALVLGFDGGRVDTKQARTLNDDAKYGTVNVEKANTDVNSLDSISKLELDPTEVTQGRLDKAIQGTRSLFKNQTEHIFERFNDAGPIISRLASTLGGNKQRAGSTNEEYVQELSGKYEGKENFDTNILIDRSGLKTSKALNAHIKENRAKYDMLIAKAVKQDVTVSALLDKNTTLELWEIDFLNDIADSNTVASKDAGSKVNLLDNAFSAAAIYGNNKAFSLALQKKGYSKTQADKLTALASSTESYGATADPESEYEDLSLSPNSTSALDINEIAKLTNDPDFKEFLEPDVFRTIVTNSTKTAARVANNKFIGKNGAKIAADLNKAYTNGEIGYNERIQLAKQLKDYVEQISGTYQFIPNQGYNKGVNLITTYAILNHLGKAALSSMPEWATGRFVDNPGRKDIHNDFKKLAKANARVIVNNLKDRGNALGISKAREDTDIDNRGTLRKLGYLQDQQSPAARVGGEYSPQQAIWVSEFMKFIGLSHITEAQRGVAAGAAVDNVRHWGLQYAFNKTANNGKPNKIASRARQQLINLGLDPEVSAEIARLEAKNPPEGSPEAEQIATTLEALKAPQTKLDSYGNVVETRGSWEDMMKTAVIRQVDTAVAMPRKGNRPKIYSDPRWRLLTLFTGYTSTVTANLLPKIAKNLFGSDRLPAERADAVKAVIGMIALAYLAQAMKEAVFGQEDWLEDDPAKWYTNLLYQSGLVGTYERPINALAPLYGHGNSVTGDAVGSIFPFLQSPVDFVIGESPALSSVDNVFDAVGGHFTNDENKARKTAKIIPLVNPLKDILTPYNKEN